MLETIAWTGESVRLLDQTKLPDQTVYVDITDERQMWDAIKRLVVRGAPAIGVAAAFGAHLGVRKHTDLPAKQFVERLKAVCDYLATSRPTAVNLFWALDRIRRVVMETMGPAAGGSSPACHTTRDLQHGPRADLPRPRAGRPLPRLRR
jgi:methylthioribose-1-phosphate isomerase